MSRFVIAFATVGKDGRKDSKAVREEFSRDGRKTAQQLM